MGGRGPWRIPERWIDYIPLGRRLPGTRFVAFKVPLKKGFEQKLLPEERFSPQDLLRKVKERKEELGLIIDLTYTNRYYGPQDLPPSLCYSKILTVGHEVPNSSTVRRFQTVVTEFLTDNRDNDKLIGVHCTHGLNRTGYLVCRYLIDVEGMEPNAAIELFNQSRGHPIERTNYIQDLQRRALPSSRELKNLGSSVLRNKSSAPAKRNPLAVPRKPGSAKKQQQQPGPRAQGLGHGAMEQDQLEQRQQEKLEHVKQRQKNHLRQKKKQNHLEQNHLEQRQNFLEQRQQEKLGHVEQRQKNRLEQRQQKKQNHLEQRQKNHLEHNSLKQRQQKKLGHVEQRQQNFLECNSLEQRQNFLEQRQQRQKNHLEQNHLEKRQQKKLEHVEQRQKNSLEQRQKNHLEQKPLEQRQPCSLSLRNSWLSPHPDQHHQEFFPLQEFSPARKRRRRKHKLGQEQRS